MSSDSPVAILYDSAGDPIASITAAGQKNLANSVLQNTRLSTANSRSTNLDPGASFTGTGESTVGISSVHVMCYSDRILQASVEQSIDNSNWDISDNFMVHPGTSRGRVFQVVGSYFRLTVTNISPLATTFLRLTTILCPISNVLPRALTQEGTLALCSQTASVSPDNVNFSNVGVVPTLRSDIEGNLVTRGQVLTDERSFRDDFTGSNIVFSLSGTSTFSNSVYVTGLSTSYLSEVKIGDYIKLDADPESDLTIVHDILSDTSLILENEYHGTVTSGAASRTNWYFQSGTGGTLTYTTTEVELNSGPNPGGNSSIFKQGDYGPMSASFVAKLSDRRANQTTALGLAETAIHMADKIALVTFTGTDNTKANFVTSSASEDLETTVVTIPNGETTATYHTYLIAVFPTECYLIIDNTRVATHTRHIPGPYDVMSLTAGIGNYGVVAGSSTVTVDVSYFCNFNHISVSPVSQQTGIYEVVAAHPNSSASSSVVAAVANTLLLASNLTRSGVTVFNDSTATLYLKLGLAASPTSYTVKMLPGAYYEAPFGYTGNVYGYWDAVNGAARVTEVY